MTLGFSQRTLVEIETDRIANLCFVTVIHCTQCDRILIVFEMRVVKFLLSYYRIVIPVIGSQSVFPNPGCTGMMKIMI